MNIKLNIPYKPLKKLIVLILLLAPTGFYLDAQESQGVALVLSGGGARGISQIGVLQEFEENNIQIDYIVGTSVGAIIGGLYSAGYSADELEEIFLNTDWEEILTISNLYDRNKMFIDQRKYYDRDLITIRFDDFKLQLPQAISSGYYFSEFLEKLIKKSQHPLTYDFDKLEYKFRAVSTNIVNGKPFVFKNGDLRTALRASSTIPLRFDPVKIDSTILIDGGPVANIPVEQTYEFNPETIISVNTTSPIYNYKDLNNPVNIADQVVSLLMQEMQERAVEKSDVVIVPELGKLSNTDFDNIEAMIDAGRKAARKYIKELKKKTPENIKSIVIQNPIENINNSKHINFSGNLENAKDSIINYVRESTNFTLSQISEYKLKEDTLLVKMNYGKIVNIKLIGNMNTEATLITNELSFEEDEYLTYNNFIESWQRLYSTELFSYVRSYIKPDNNDSNTLVIELNEKGRQLFLLGGRVDNERNAQIEIDFLQENLLNRGARLIFGFSGGLRNQNVNLNISNPQLFSTPLNFNIMGYYSNINYYLYDNFEVNDNSYQRDRVGEYAVEKVGASIALGTNIQKTGKINFGFQVEQQRTFNIDSTNKPDFQPVSTFFVKTLIDNRNKVTFTESGSLVDLSFESNLITLDEDITFSKMEFTFDSYITIADEHTLNPFVKFGLADRTAPLAEFWGLGGQNTFFGMREFERSGRQIFISSLEYRIKSPVPLFFDTYLSLRYDLGGIWELPEEVKFTNLRHGAGGELSFDTPVGPAKFALGQSFYFVKNPDGVVLGPLLAYFAIGINL